MIIRINGEQKAVNGPLTVFELLEQLGIAPTSVAVELNRRIVERGAYPATTIKEGDVLEIIRLVGGG